MGVYMTLKMLVVDGDELELWQQNLLVFVIRSPLSIELSSPFGHGLNLLLPHCQEPCVNLGSS